MATRWWLLWVLLGACAHAPARGSLEALRPAAETFHQRVRWRDFRGASELVVPEKRGRFLKVAGNERDLTVTDYQLEDAQLSADGQKATVVSRLSWVRLPSVSEQTDVVESVFVFRDGAWFLDAQDVGPFAGLSKAKKNAH